MTDPHLRASDDDRRRVVAALEKHAAAGRLTLDEYGERVDRVLSARTHADLAAVTGDLPAEREGKPAGEDSRHLLLAFALAFAVLVIFAVVLKLAA